MLRLFPILKRNGIESLKEKHVFSIGLCNYNLINCLEQVTWDIICKRQGVLDEKKGQQIQVHHLTPLYTYCHMQLWCNYFGHNESKWCVATRSIIELFNNNNNNNNNLRHSIQMFGWSYIMACGLMSICHVTPLKWI